MKTMISATVATLSLGVGAAFAQGLPAGFNRTGLRSHRRPPSPH